MTVHTGGLQATPALSTWWSPGHPTGGLQATTPVVSRPPELRQGTETMNLCVAPCPRLARARDASLNDERQ